jgi:hypothetical protein
MKRVLLAILLTLVFPLASFAQETCKRHSEPQGGFSFCPPEGWSINEDPNRKFKGMVAPRIDNFTPNLNVTELENVPMSLKDLVAAVIDLYSKETEKMETSHVGPFNQSEFTTLSKQPGMKMSFQSEKDGLRIRTTHYFFMGKGNSKIMVLFMALERDAEALDPIFDRSMKTWQMDAWPE